MKRKGIISMAAALAATSIMPAMPVFAANYTAIPGTTTAFDKYLVMDADANVPNVTFDYSIAAGTAMPAVPGTSMQVYAGNDAAATNGVLPTIAANQAAFAPADTTATTVATGDGVTLDQGEKYAKKAVTIDFTGVQYKEPGVYRYVLTETSSGQQGISYDTQAATAGSKTRYLDVYVEDKGDGTLKIGGYVINETAETVSVGTDLGSVEDDSKSKGFVNEYQTYDLTFSKAVSGNQASRDKYFKFTVQLAGATAGTVYDVDISNAHETPVANGATVYADADMATANGADDNATKAGKQIVTDTSGEATKDFYLQHGQSITIKGLPAGATYTVSELKEDYKPAATTAGDANASVASTKDSVSSTGIAGDSTNAFTNTRDGIVPTGIMLSVVPGAIVVLGAAAGIVAIKSRKKDDDEA